MSSIHSLIVKGINLLYTFTLLDSTNNFWEIFESSPNCAVPQTTRLAYISIYNNIAQFATINNSTVLPLCNSTALIDMSLLNVYRSVLDFTVKPTDLPFLLAQFIDPIDCSQPFIVTNLSITSSSNLDHIRQIVDISKLILSWSLYFVECNQELEPVDWASLIPLSSSSSTATDHQTVCVNESIESAIAYLNLSISNPPRSPDICFPLITSYNVDNLHIGSLIYNVLTIPSLSTIPPIPSSWINPLYPINKTTTCLAPLIGTSFDCSQQDLWSCTTVGGCTTTESGDCMYVSTGYYSASGDLVPSPCDSIIDSDQEYVGIGWTNSDCPTRCSDNNKILTSSGCLDIQTGYFGSPCDSDPSTLYPCLISSHHVPIRFHPNSCQGLVLLPYSFPSTTSSLSGFETWFKLEDPVPDEPTMIMGIVGKFLIAISQTFITVCWNITGCFQYTYQSIGDTEWHHLYVNNITVEIDGHNLFGERIEGISDMSLPHEMAEIFGYWHYGPVYIPSDIAVSTGSAYAQFVDVSSWPEITLFDTRVVTGSDEVRRSSFNLTAPPGWFGSGCTYSSPGGYLCEAPPIYSPTTSTSTATQTWTTTTTTMSSPDPITMTTVSTTTTTSAPADTMIITTITSTDSDSANSETSGVLSSTDETTTSTDVSSETTVATTSWEYSSEEIAQEIESVTTSMMPTTVKRFDTSSEPMSASEETTQENGTNTSSANVIEPLIIVATESTPLMSVAPTVAVTSSAIVSESPLPVISNRTTTIYNTEVEVNVIHSMSSTTGMYRFASTGTISTTTSALHEPVKDDNSNNLPLYYTATVIGAIALIICISYFLKLYNGRRSARRVQHFD